MPGAVGVALAGLAAGTWKELWELFRQKYGRFGEETCKRLQMEIEEAKAENASMWKFIDILDERTKLAKVTSEYYLSQWIAADARANELAGRLNEAMCKIERLENPLPGNPYPEPGTNAPDTEETPS